MLLYDEHTHISVIYYDPLAALTFSMRSV